MNACLSLAIMIILIALITKCRRIPVLKLPASLNNTSKLIQSFTKMIDRFQKGFIRIRFLTESTLFAVARRRIPECIHTSILTEIRFHVKSSTMNLRANKLTKYTVLHQAKKNYTWYIHFANLIISRQFKIETVPIYVLSGSHSSIRT